MSTALTILEYSEKSFVLLGDTKQYKDEIKELGGRWNSNLDLGAEGLTKGWIFSNKNLDKIKEWIEIVSKRPQGELITSSKTSESEPLKIQSYSEKSFVLLGDTKPYKEELKNMNGKYNSNLTVDGNPAKGWIFSKKHQENIEKWINEKN